MITEEKLVSFGADKLAHILLSLYEDQKNLRKQLDIIFAGLEENPKKIVSLVKKEIASLKKSSRFIDYYEAESFAQRLNDVRLRIVNDLREKSPTDALSCLLDFLDLHNKTFEHVDDSNGFVGDTFRQACQDLRKVYQKISIPPEGIVNTVFQLFMKNEYGIYDEIIESCKDALGTKGLGLLRTKLETEVTGKNAQIIRLGLQQIADCFKDVEAYIQACQFHGTPSAHDHLEISKRLIEHWKGEEALEWLERMKIPASHPWNNERSSLKIQALELCGKYDKAQDERFIWFDRTLSPKVYGEILKNIRPELKEELVRQSLEKVFKDSDLYRALSFLVQTQHFEELAKFVRLHITDLDGSNYYVLRPAADILQEIDLLSSTLLYRKLLEPVLEKAKSKYYSYATKDLLKCSLSKDKIKDWEKYTPHDIYYNTLLTQHKCKVSFWAEYKKQLEKPKKQKSTNS